MLLIDQFDMGFYDDIMKIIDTLQKRDNTFFILMRKNIENLASKYFTKSDFS